MSSYVEGDLIKDEKIICMGQVSWWSMLPLFILSIPLLFLMGLGLVL